MSQFADLKVDHDQAAQLPMVKQEIYPIPLLADPQPPLPSDERKIVAEFEQEFF